MAAVVWREGRRRGKRSLGELGGRGLSDEEGGVGNEEERRGVARCGRDSAASDWGRHVLKVVTPKALKLPSAPAPSAASHPRLRWLGGRRLRWCASETTRGVKGNKVELFVLLVRVVPHHHQLLLSCRSVGLPVQ